MRTILFVVVSMLLFGACDREGDPWVVAENDTVAATDETMSVDEGAGEKEEMADDQGITDEGVNGEDDLLTDEDLVEPEIPFVSGVAMSPDWGDITVSFILSPEDGEPRDLMISYRGGCAAEWTPIDTPSSLKGLAAEPQTVVWYSWEQEAGCAGEIFFRFESGKDAPVEAGPFYLMNVEEHSGFVVLPQEKQGINPGEEELYAKALDFLVADPGTDFVATRIGENTYEVTAARGKIRFTRVNTNKGYRYDVEVLEGGNPIENQSQFVAPTYAEELALGSNPNNATVEGYADGDPRLSFIDLKDEVYPYGYERIAAYFDHYDSADLMVNWANFAHFAVAPGEHASLNLIQSRSPFVAWGKGILPGVYEGPLRHVDVAPTVMKMLGAPKTDCVDERGIFSHHCYLRWQDGHVIEEILSGELVQTVIIVTCDGLNHTELHRRIDTEPEKYSTIAKMRNEGMWAKYGSITNWPSVTYPSHNVLGSGAYSGHHGLVDNSYYYRDTKESATPIGDTFNTEKYWNPVIPEQVESLHMALHRAFGQWDEPNGAYTASFFDPSVSDADTADLEFRDRSGQVPLVQKALSSLIPFDGLTYPNVSVTESYSIFGEQMTELASMTEFYNLFEKVQPRPKFVIMNFPATDGTGHDRGPHGDLMGKVLEHIDNNLRVMFNWFAKWGMLENTVVILTSDHGMQLADPTRSSDPIANLRAAKIVDFQEKTGLGVYFK